MRGVPPVRAGPAPGSGSEDKDAARRVRAAGARQGAAAGVCGTPCAPSSTSTRSSTTSPPSSMQLLQGEDRREGQPQAQPWSHKRALPAAPRSAWTECISYVSSNLQYADSGCNLVKFRQLQTRALGMVRSHALAVLRSASSQVRFWNFSTPSLVLV